MRVQRRLMWRLILNAIRCEHTISKLITYTNLISYITNSAMNTLVWFQYEVISIYRTITLSGVDIRVLYSSLNNMWTCGCKSKPHYRRATRCRPLHARTLPITFMYLLYTTIWLDIRIDSYDTPEHYHSNI